MIIGIDGNEANVARRVGVSEFAFELLEQFASFGFAQEKKWQFQIYLKNKPLAVFPDESTNWKYEVFGPRKAWTQFALPARLFLESRKPDVFFTPSHYAPRFSPVPTVISIMDLAYMQFPEMFTQHDLYQLKNWTAYSVKQAKKIITISNSSKHDILEIYGVSEEKVTVVYPGIKQNAVSEGKRIPMDELRKKYGIGDNYILFVGTLQPRKNITRLIEAFSKIIGNREAKIGGKNLQLVIVGKKGWHFEEILTAPKQFEVSEQVKFLDYVPDEDLPSLYKNAICFAWPALYEGFGLPILEAMQYECPVITSSISSMPEAGGDACLYVDPKDVQDIAKKLQMLLDSEKLRKELVEKGKQQVKKFSWEKAARETLGILEGVGKGK